MKENTITVLIADDEPGIRLILRNKIEKTPGFSVISEAENGQDALKIFDAFRPDVVFLDVDMPEVSGIECARIIQDKDPKCVLIFATGHEEYMSEAFEVYAFDYLVKPFNMERLQGTLQRILDRGLKSEAIQSPRVSIQQNKPSRLLLRHKEGIAFLDPEDIILIQREDRATVIYAKDEARYVISETLQEIENRLDPDLFFRCHKSYIVNIQYIRDITPYGRWTYVIQLDGTKHDALITHEKYEELEKRFS